MATTVLRACQAISVLLLSGVSMPRETARHRRQPLEWTGGLGAGSAVVVKIPRELLLAAAIAAATRRLGVGSDIIILPLRHPIEVAEELLVLDNLEAVLQGGSQGRVGHYREGYEAYGTLLHLVGEICSHILSQGRNLAGSQCLEIQTSDPLYSSTSGRRNRRDNIAPATT